MLQEEILRLLQAHESAGAIQSMTLTDLVSATQQSDNEIRRVCDELEAYRWVTGRGGDWNPSYEITLSGMLVLEREE